MQSFNIAIIGAGNMGQSLIGGLVANGVDPDRIWVTDPSLDKLQHIQGQYGVNITLLNKEAALKAETLLLAVKPQLMPMVAQELREIVQQTKPLIISIAAGIPLQALQHWLGNDCAIVRCMPNTPALIQCGATGMYANQQVSTSQRERAEGILQAVGITAWVQQESALDIVTALSGSGPAYFFLIMEALEQAAVQLGLDKEMAHTLTLQTAYGAARLAASTKEPLATLRERVTSKGGTTEQALRVLEKGKLPNLLAEAVQAAHLRSQSLAQQIGVSRDQ